MVLLLLCCCSALLLLPQLLETSKTSQLWMLVASEMRYGSSTVTGWESRGGVKRVVCAGVVCKARWRET